jgi:poly-gamma-glutamate synthesis protein (capsule biosynthesis protein)
MRPDPDSAFTGASQYLQDADITFCNLETVLADEKYLEPDDPYSMFPRTDEWMFESHVKAGINVVSQANNPNTYHGRAPLVRSLEVLDAHGVVHGGVGRNLTEARQPAIIERNGTRVAFVCRTLCGLQDLTATEHTAGVAYYPALTSYGPGPNEHNNPYNYPGSRPLIHTKAAQGKHRDALEADIAQARELADVVMVPVHWGLMPAHYYPGATLRDVEIFEYQQEVGRMAIDFGADMVVGTGTHMVGPIEVYRGKAILYSLGSFTHDSPALSNRFVEAMLMRCHIQDGRIERLAYIPGTIRGNGPPVFARPSDAKDVVDLIRDISASFATEFEVGDDDVAIVLDGR